MQKRIKDKIDIIIIMIIMLTSCSSNKITINDYFEQEKKSEDKACKKEYEQFLKSAKEVTDSETINFEYSDNCEDKIAKFDVFKKNTLFLMDSIKEDKSNRYIILNRDYLGYYDGKNRPMSVLIDTYKSDLKEKYTTFDENSNIITRHIDSKEFEYFKEIENYLKTKKSKILSKTKKTIVSYYIVTKDKENTKIEFLYGI